MLVRAALVAAAAVAIGARWHQARRNASRCGLQRIDEAALDPTTFARVSSSAVIVQTNRTYDVDGPTALSGLAGDLDVLAGDSRELMVAGDVVVRLSDFLVANDTTDYVFHLDVLRATRAHALRLQRFFSVPPFLRHEQIDARAWRHYLLVGRRGAFVSRHSHARGWNLLVYGSKEWTLSRPLSFESHTCVQQPGDLLWIPDHWHHAVVSRDETFGVAYQGRSTSPPPEMYAWMAGVLLALASLIAAVVWWCCCRGKAAAETPPPRAAFT